MTRHGKVLGQSQSWSSCRAGRGGKEPGQGKDSPPIEKTSFSVGREESQWKRRLTGEEGWKMASPEVLKRTEVTAYKASLEHESLLQGVGSKGVRPAPRPSDSGGLNAPRRPHL